MINRSPFGSSLTCETLRLGWCCLNSPMTVRHDLNWESKQLRILESCSGLSRIFWSDWRYRRLFGGPSLLQGWKPRRAESFTLLALTMHLGELVLLANR